ncbi:hypothetical protein NHP21011_14510 [Helicobacter heilmannii]|uniref:hypothetical protein n=1 Tax=Helicobacter heilmannii TaxID=35817 RepID=UPI00244D915D|nr:hypothetical protein [Helicobacter heilmannii]GMB95348.1 hypothetical protein NHP21011_14510 [Helicobacter heilmannii]
MKKFLGIITNVSKYPSAEKPTSLWLGEAVYFAHEVEKAGYAVDYASHKGTYTPIDPNDYAGGHGAVWDFPDNAALTQVAHLQQWGRGVLCLPRRGRAVEHPKQRWELLDRRQKGDRVF